MKAATKRGRGRPPKAPEDKAAVTIHVRFTASEIDALDAHLERQRKRCEVGAIVTRSSFVRALVLRATSLAQTGAKPARKPKP